MLKKSDRTKQLITFSLCFLIPALVALAAAVLLRFYPFGESSILTGDLRGIYLPSMAGYRDMLLEGKSLAFTFSKQLGGSFYNFFIPYLFTPLNYLYLLIPVTEFPALVLFIFIFRIGLSGLTCAFALKYFNSELSPAFLICLSSSYALLGYEIAYNQINDWHFFIVILPVLCVLTERFITKNSFLPFALTLFFTVMHFYYFAYMVCFFLGAFFICRLYIYCGNIEKSSRGSFFIKKTAFFVFISFISVLLTSFYLIPTVIGASADKGGLFKMAFSLELNYNPLGLISKFFVGSFAWNNIVDGLPVVYCGLICLPLILLFFQNKNISSREKIASGALFLLFLIVSVNKTFNLILHGGSAPNWFPYRYTFVICFFAVFVAGRCAGTKLAPTKKQYLITGSLFLVFAVIAYFVNENIPSVKRIAVSLILLFAYLAFFWLNSKGKPSQIINLLLVLAVSFELLLNTYFTLSVFEYYDYNHFAEFITTNSESLEKAESLEDGFYRIEKTYHETYNDPLWLNYNGNSLFSSQTDITQRFSELMGYDRNIYARGSTAFSDALLSFKYLLADDESTLPSHYDAFDTSLPHPLYKSRYTLPLCFVCGSGVKEIDIEKFPNTFALQNAMLCSLSGQNKDYFSPLLEAARSYDAATNSGEITFTAESDLYGYAWLGTTASNGVELYVNGKALGKYDTTNFQSVINLGEFSKGDEITFKYDFYDESARITGELFYGLDKSIFEEAYALLQNGAPEKLTVKDGLVTLTVNSDGEKTLFTSLLYSPYWEITVNGENADGVMLFNSLLGVELQDGVSEIVIRYVPPYLGAAIALSVVAAAILISLYFFSKKRPEMLKGLTAKTTISE